MKKIFISACMAALALLTGCQQDNEWVNDNATTEGRKVTLTAHLPGDGHSRVALEADTDDKNKPIVKAKWKDSGERFEVYTENSTSSITFMQVEGNQFQSTGTSDTPEGPCTAYYPEKNYDISKQDGTLNQGTCVLMEAAVTDFDSPIRFAHKTAILKPDFKMLDGSDISNSSITQIVVHNVKNPKADNETLKSLTVTPEQLEDIYLFLPAHENYELGYVFSFEVTVSGQNDNQTYFGTLALTAGTSIQAGKLYTATIKLNQNQYPYVTFTAESGNQTLSYNGTDLEYSTDGDTWISFDGTGSDAVAFGDGIKLYLRGNGNWDGTATNIADYSKISFGNSTPVACTGDIRTLLDYESYATVSTTKAKFCGLFEDCTALTSAPALPATDLEESSYRCMFQGCTSLETAPALPATDLAESCYSNMFYGCTKLEKAPALPATDLAAECYARMFQGCTALATAPELPATILAGYCYQSMFQGCTSLATAPELKATDLVKSCYQNMFYGCTSLATAPELPAETLAKECYRSMFEGCTSLTSAPVLPATTLEAECYARMFCDCTALTSASALPAETLAEKCYYSMFEGCTALHSVTMLATDINAYDCLYDWLTGVADSGTLYVHAGMTKTMESRIPTGWSVEEYSEP